MTSTTASVAGKSPKPTKFAVASWALYDLANTVFSMNITSLYLPLWVVNTMGGSDADYGNAASLSMLMIFLSAPILGALSDRAGRRMPFLAIVTVLCIAFTAMLGLGGLTTSMIIFIIANYMFQAGLIFYDALLPVVSTEENRGKISGLGVGLGYVGSFIGVVSGLLLLDQIGSVGIFRVSAILFLVFALPCFFFVKERSTTAFRFRTKMITEAFAQVRHTIANARGFPGLVRFLIGRMFYTEPVNTLIIFMGIFVSNEVGFSANEVQILLLVSIKAAVIGGFVFGPIVDNIGPKRTLNCVLIMWMVVLSGAMTVAVFDLPGILFWGIGCIAGVALGGTWTADRLYLMRLAPPKYLGEFYGLFRMAGRFASIIGPLTWGLITTTLGFGRPVAVFVLLLFVVISYIVLQGVDDKKRDWPAELKVE
ncbi:MFS transporter [Chloroflexota bacterium]